jgi:hypothetical protein
MRCAEAEVLIQALLDGELDAGHAWIVARVAPQNCGAIER